MTDHDVDFAKTVRLGSGGRLVVPAEVRERMGWKADEAHRIRIVDGQVQLESVADGVRRAQRIVAEHWKGRGSMVDELIADRRAEVAGEDAEAKARLALRRDTEGA